MACGIYSITNTANGKRYFGSSLNVLGRKRQHIYSLRKGAHRNKHLQAAWNLYGESCFVFAIVEEVPAERLQVVEQSYLDSNSDGYNVSKCAECAPRGLRWSDDAKKRMSEARKGRKLSDETKRKLSESGKGRKRTAEQCRAASQRMAGTSLGEASKKKISVALRAMWQDPAYRERITAAQSAGKKTRKAKANYSIASREKWGDAEYRAKMSAERKARWADPAYRARMMAARKTQGQQLRDRNALKQAEKEHAFS